MRKRGISASVIAVILALILVIAGFPVQDVVASNGSTLLAVDVGTSNGGQGQNVPGGQYKVGEEPVIYFGVSAPCQSRLTISGPLGTDSTEAALEPGITYQVTLGQARKRHIGQWRVVLEAWKGKQSASDATWFSVVDGGQGAVPPTQPEPESESEPTPVPLTPDAEVMVAGKVNTSNADELIALITMMMVEGLLTANPNMDANGDGQVTLEDVRLIMQWAVKGDGKPPQGGADGVIESGPSPVDIDALVGEWEMTRISVKPDVPVPDMILNRLIDKKAAWEITSNGGQLQIKYGGRDTWYKKTFLKGISEGTATVQEGSNKLSATFTTQGGFHVESLPVLIRFLLPRKVERVNGAFVSAVDVSVAADTLTGTIILKNVTGTYWGEGEDGQMRQKPINVETTTIIYQGTKRE